MTYQFTPPNLPSSTILCLSSSTKIAASAAHVFRVLTDTSTWPQWNTFCPTADITSTDHSLSSPEHTVIRSDSHMTLHVRMTSTSSLRHQRATVTEYAIPGSSPLEPRVTQGAYYKISWDAQGIPGFLLRTHRTNEVQDILSSGNGGKEVICEYRTWEVMAGPLAWIVKWIYGTVLQERFEDWSRDLKGFAEKTWSEKMAADEG